MPKYWYTWPAAVALYLLVIAGIAKLVDVFTRWIDKER